MDWEADEQLLAASERVAGRRKPQAVSLAYQGKIATVIDKAHDVLWFTVHDRLMLRCS